MKTKILHKDIPCTLFKIGTPRWNGNAKRREVGLNETLISEHNEIVFTYTRKSDGQQSIPGSFYFDGNKLAQIDFERQNVKGLTLVIVPFSELEELRRADDPESLKAWLGDERYAKTKEQLDEQN